MNLEAMTKEGICRGTVHGLLYHQIQVELVSFPSLLSHGLIQLVYFCVVRVQIDRIPPLVSRGKNLVSGNVGVQNWDNRHGDTDPGGCEM